MRSFRVALAIPFRPRAFIGTTLLMVTVCLMTPNDTQGQGRSATAADAASSSGDQRAPASKSRTPSPTSREPKVMQALNNQNVVNGDSKYMADVERFAKTQGCSDPTAKAVLRWPPAEMFAVDCRGTDQMLVKCERDACLEMR